MASSLITRKEIAALTGFSVRTIERREADWGLCALRVPAASARNIYYQRRLVIWILVRLRLLDTSNVVSSDKQSLGVTSSRLP